MPTPSLYLVALTAAALASVAVAWLCKRLRLPAELVCVLAVAAGMVCGAWILRLPLVWPPINGLGRVLTVLLPGAVAVELVAALAIHARWLGWCGRMALAFVAARVVLAGSVYLSGDAPQWPPAYALLVLLASGALLAGVWLTLHWLARRSGGVSLPLSLAQTAVCGGLAIMLKGYLSGGEAALPLAGALVGCGVAVSALKLPKECFAGAVGVAVVVLFGLLLVGRFFGQLSTARMLALFLAPLLCWVSELKPLRRQPPWRMGLLRLAVVAVPLIVVVMLAKSDFERDTRPLLSSRVHDDLTTRTSKKDV